MLIGPSDRYGDLDIEDLDEFQELEPEDYAHDGGFDPMAGFQRDEVRSFERDFERELEEDDYYDEEAPLDVADMSEEWGDYDSDRDVDEDYYEEE